MCTEGAAAGCQGSGWGRTCVRSQGSGHSCREGQSLASTASRSGEHLGSGEPLQDALLFSFPLGIVQKRRHREDNSPSQLGDKAAARSVGPVQNEHAGPLFDSRAVSQAWGPVTHPAGGALGVPWQTPHTPHCTREGQDLGHYSPWNRAWDTCSLSSTHSRPHCPRQAFFLS